MEYKLRYNSIDRVSKSATFKTKKGALGFVKKWIGDNADISEAFNYIVSSDGIGKVTALNFKLKELFEVEEPAAPCPVCESHEYPDDWGVTYGPRDEIVSVHEFKCTCGKKEVQDHIDLVNRQTFFNCCDGCEYVSFDWDTNTPCSATCEEFFESQAFFRRNPELFAKFLEWKKARDKEEDKACPF